MYMTMTRMSSREKARNVVRLAKRAIGIVKRKMKGRTTAYAEL